MLVQAKINQKCTNNVQTNALGSGRTEKFLNGFKNRNK